MKRALLLSGGAARGAVQVFPCEQLLNKFHITTFRVWGVSTGSLTGAMFAQNKMAQLRNLYLQVDGTDFFMRPNIEHPLKGLNTLKPLKKHLEDHVVLEDFCIPFACGVTDLESDRYRTLDHVSFDSDDQLRNAILASCAEPVIMDWWDVKVGENDFHICMDGGLVHVIPYLHDWEDYDEIYAILCRPPVSIDPLPAKKVDTIPQIAARCIDIWTDGVIAADIARLKGYAKAGKKVVLYAPKDSGDPLDASKETIRWRLFEVGPEMWANPTVL